MNSQLLTEITPLVGAIFTEASAPSTANAENLITAVATLILALTGSKLPIAAVTNWLNATYTLYAAVQSPAS